MIGAQKEIFACFADWGQMTIKWEAQLCSTRFRPYPSLTSYRKYLPWLEFR